jgi:hypothetical protein
LPARKAQKPKGKARPTRAKPAHGSPPVPSELTGKEPNLIVAKAKAALAKKYKPSRSACIDDGVTIAWYLVALGRFAEAASLAHKLATEPALEKHNEAWYQATYALALSARLARRAKKPKEAAAAIARIAANPSVTDGCSEKDFRKWVAQDAEHLADARTETSPAWRRIGALAALQDASYFRETAGHGFYYDAWVDTKQLDRLIDESLAFLAENLTGSR